MFVTQHNTLMIFKRFIIQLKDEAKIEIFYEYCGASPWILPFEFFFLHFSLFERLRPAIFKTLHCQHISHNRRHVTLVTAAKEQIKVVVEPSTEL